MRSWATGVAIVSTTYEGTQHGMTINSFTSISLDPPRLLISLEKETRTHRLLTRSELFCVTLLAEDQQYISERFSGGLDDKQDRFDGLKLSSSPNGNPIIDGGLAYFDCRVFNAQDVGSHTLFIGEILALGEPNGRGPNLAPLLYFDRKYRKIGN